MTMDWAWVVAGVAAVVAAPGLVHVVAKAARSRTARRGLEFNLIDEAIHHLDTDAEPWTVHLEARLSGAVDEARLRHAVRRAMDHHPLARAFQRRWRPWQTAYEWGLDDTPSLDPVSVVSADSDEELAERRAEFLSTKIPLATSPPLRVLLVRRGGSPEQPRGDRVVLAFNHAACDGVGTLRFFLSVARAYSDEPDPVSAPKDAAVRDLAKSSAPGTLFERHHRLMLVSRGFVDALTSPPTRIAADEPADAPGFGFALRSVDAATTASIAKRKLASGTVNDLLLGVLHCTIARWNDQHAVASKRIGTMMPVNVRPRARWTETVGNIVYFVSISSDPAERETLEGAVGAVVRQTTEVKERGTAAALREILFASPALLLEVKRRLPSLLPFGGNRFIDSAALSNVGRVDAPIRFGELGPALDLWFSPPCRMPLALGMGAATYDGRLSFVFRYRRALWSDEAASRFASLYVATLGEALS